MNKTSLIEAKVISFLGKNQCSDLYILSDFYENMCKWLNLDDGTQHYDKNLRKIQSFLRSMKNKKLVDWRRCGTGIGGKSTFGMTSLNSYATYDLWNK